MPGVTWGLGFGILPSGELWAHGDNGRWKSFFVLDRRGKGMVYTTNSYKGLMIRDRMSGLETGCLERACGERWLDGGRRIVGGANVKKITVPLIKIMNLLITRVGNIHRFVNDQNQFIDAAIGGGFSKTRCRKFDGLRGTLVQIRGVMEMNKNQRGEN